MTGGGHLLLLAGSGEARHVASRLARLPLRVTASVFETDHWSGPLPVPTRSGGFGGAHAFSTFLKNERITAVLDATHPFAARISARSWTLCRDMGLPYLQLLRRAWEPQAGDRWTRTDTAEAAARATPVGARVFVTTGRETLSAFTTLTDRQFFLRRLSDDPQPSHWPHIAFVPGRGPFSEDQERATFERLGIDCLICKNAGGLLSRTKLDAARNLGLPVILLNRPPQSGAPCVDTVDAALDWVQRRCL